MPTRVGIPAVRCQLGLELRLAAGRSALPRAVQFFDTIVTIQKQMVRPGWRIPGALIVRRQGAIELCTLRQGSTFDDQRFEDL